MDRSSFNDGIEIESSQLQQTELSKAFHIQQRTIDTTNSGRVSGLTVSLGSPTSRLSVSGGRGYTPRGDLVELGDAGSSNMALSDYTLGVENYIVLCYREVPGAPQEHETSGTAQDTIVTRSSECKIITKAEYDALPTSEDSSDLENNLTEADLDADAQDRMVVLARVFGKGHTASTPNVFVSGDFTNGNIIQQDFYETVLSAVLEADSVITGVNIVSLSSTASEGTGTLQLRGSLGAWTLVWHSPDSEGNSAIGTILNAAAFGSDSEPQQITIVAEADADTVASTIVVEVFTDLLPSSGLPIDTEVTITRLYEAVSEPFSTKDVLHRSRTGTYIPTAENPHGLGFADLEQSVAVIGKPMVLGTDFLGTETAALQARLTTPLSTAVGVDYTLLWQMTGGTSVVRFYLDSVGALVVTSNAQWSGTQWVKDINSGSNYASKLVWGVNGFAVYINAVMTTPFADAAFQLKVLSGGAFGGSPEAALLTLGSSFVSSSADYLRARLRTYHNGADRTLLWDALNSSSGAGKVPTRIYSYTGGIEIAQNALWGGATWTQDQALNTSQKVVINVGGISVLTKDAGAGAWDDSSWDDLITSLTPGGDLTILDDMHVGQTVFGGTQAQTFASDENLVPRFSARFPITATPTGERWLIHEAVNTTTGFGWREYAFASNSTFRTEKAFGCVWNGTAWEDDGSGAGHAYVWRVGNGPTHKVSKASPSGTWSDTSGWDYCDRAFGKVTVVATTESLTGFNATVSYGLNTQLVVAFDIPLETANYAITFSNGATSALLGPYYTSQTQAGFTIMATVAASGAAVDFNALGDAEFGFVALSEA